MNIYISIGWALVGLAISVFGSMIWKKNLFNVTVCPKKESFKDKDKFTETYGKDVSFLGTMTMISSVIGFGDGKYLTAALAVNALAIIYFACEVMHLSKRFSKE